MPMDLVIEETDSLPPMQAQATMPPGYRPGGGRPSLSPRLSPVSNSDHHATPSALCTDQV